MSARLQLDSYIARVQRRLQLRATLRGLAILAAAALAITVAQVLLLNHYAFPAHAVSDARLGMFGVLAAIAVLALVWPLSHLTRTRAVRDAERAHPHLEQRLITFHQRALTPATGPANPFLDLLAADTLARTEAAPASALAPTFRLFALTSAALVCALTLLWTITSAPGFLGYGAALLWQGPKPHVAPLYALAVIPGDVAVRRNSDQLITAQLTGLSPEKVQLFARYGSAPAWEPVTMQPQPDAAANARGYQFIFTGLPETVEYYVAAGPLTSPHYKVRVVDLPSVKAIRVTYHYPKWTGMKSVTEEHSGDLRALEGTDAQVELEMDRPLKDGQLLLDDGHALRLSSSKPNTYQASIHMGKDGAYHIAATDAGQSVRLSEDYFIATGKALSPEVTLDRPGRDYRASPIEEVTVGVKASAQFGLNDMHLHYSVNGGPDRDVPLLKAPGAKDANGAYTLRLEDFKLVPGDLVSLYATARDGHAEARTDITFIQAEPFEREFSQSQQSGGGGGGGGQQNQTEISKREKELVAATWKQQNDKAATPKDAAAAGQFLADAQSKLRDQVLALSARMQSRDLSAATEEFSGFEKDMQTAAAAMAPSSGKLKDMQWKDALPLEQKALQALLRAEATFRQIQVAFGQQQGGGEGGGGSSAGRDLASLFDLELDTAKNQYETAQTASPAEQHAKDVESALEKLDALAKRQEELASNQHSPQQSFEERWQQEMLRREAEQLQRQMEQLAKNNQSQQGSQQQNGQQQSGAKQQSSSSSSGQSGSQSGSQSSQSASQQQASSSQGAPAGQNSAQRNRQQSGAGQSASDPRIEQALSRLQQASESMKRSASPQQDANAARQAADRLRQAAGLLGQTQQQLASGKTDTLSREAERLTEQERDQAAQIDKLVHDAEASSSSGDAASMMARVRERNRLAAERQQLSNDLSKLQKNLRDAAREMASNQPTAAQKLREALTDMDQSDLDNHVQRTADWLRRGINPNSSGTEADIAKGLGKLNQQLRQAQQASGTGPVKPAQRGTASQGADQTAALGQVERLRTQLEAMTGSRDGRQSKQPQGARGGQTGQRGNEPGSQAGTQAGNQSQPNGGSQPPERSQAQGHASEGGNQASEQAAQSGAPQSAGAQGQLNHGRNSSQAGNSNAEASDRSGDLRRGGGGSAGSTAWNNVNTGNNTYGQPGQRPTPTSPPDSERTYQQSLRELNQLRGMIGGDPQAAKDVTDLTRRMQQLDPKRFPGNPAMFEQLHREMLSTVDRLELRLRSEDTAPEARTGKPPSIPAGYQDSVAEYYRRLSAKP